ncbi:MAG TPA: RNA polymerase sigma factor [Chthonomonadaceae bacterium]|nr:RNA polymerase sigma factor [Chthonomonadaceae bacterium]
MKATMIAIDQRQIRRSEEQLTERCRQGDLDAFGQVYMLYERNVYRYAFYLLGHSEDAADVKQETFIKAYQAIGTFRGNSSLLTWLLKICINLCRDRLRTRKSHYLLYEHITRETLDGGTSAQDPYACAERSQTIATILRGLQGLSPAQREIIILRDIEGLEYGEIARALGCTAPTAKMRLHRARHSLKERVISLMEAREEPCE